VSAARAALTTRDLDGELAVLLADSGAEESIGVPLEAVRTEAVYRTRLLSFGGAGVQIDLEVGGRADQLDVMGQLTGADPQGCAIQHGSAGSVPLDVDSLGRFLCSGLVPGPIRIRCRSAGGTPVSTTWVTV
jgi:hypothetical protein